MLTDGDECDKSSTVLAAMTTSIPCEEKRKGRIDLIVPVHCPALHPSADPTTFLRGSGFEPKDRDDSTASKQGQPPSIHNTVPPTTEKS